MGDAALEEAVGLDGAGEAGVVFICLGMVVTGCLGGGGWITATGKWEGTTGTERG